MNYQRQTSGVQSGMRWPTIWTVLNITLSVSLNIKELRHQTAETET